MCNYPLATQNIVIEQLPAQGSQPEQGTSQHSFALGRTCPSMGTPSSHRALQFPKSLNIAADPRLELVTEGQTETCTRKQPQGNAGISSALPCPFSTRAPSCWFPAWDKFLGMTGTTSCYREYPSVLTNHPWGPSPREGGPLPGPAPLQSVRDADALSKELLQMFLIKAAHPEPTRSNHPPKRLPALRCSQSLLQDPAGILFL